MSINYVCPKCGAYDSGRCAFRIRDSTGTVIPSQQDKAREAGCRVVHYTDRFAATGSYFTNPARDERPTGASS